MTKREAWRRLDERTQALIREVVKVFGDLRAIRIQFNDGSEYRERKAAKK